MGRTIPLNVPTAIVTSNRINITRIAIPSNANGMRSINNQWFEQTLYSELSSYKTVLSPSGHEPQRTPDLLKAHGLS